jgi:hypothetical protein
MILYYLSNKAYITNNIDNTMTVISTINMVYLYPKILVWQRKPSGVSRVWQVGHVSWAPLEGVPLRGFSA